MFQYATNFMQNQFVFFNSTDAFNYLSAILYTANEVLTAS